MTNKQLPGAVAAAGVFTSCEATSFRLVRTVSVHSARISKKVEREGGVGIEIYIF